MENKKTKQNELNKGRSFREERILELFKELENQDQKNIYGLVCSLTAKNLLYKLEKGKEKKETN